MSTKRYPTGSEWRKWDLHVHTASSEETQAYKGSDSDTLLVNAWRKNEFAAVAVTDHFVIDTQRISTLRALAPEITIFPGVELRTDKGTTNIHPIIIFPDTIDLNILDAAFKTFKNEKAEAKESIDTIHWNFKDIVDFANKYEGLISIHAGKKSNSIEEISNDNSLNMAVKAGYAENVHIFEVGKLADILNYQTKVFPNLNQNLKKPLILCSDNHDPRNYTIKEYLWIKANPTFEGLKQILLHPNERVFVGNTPPKIDKLNKNKSRYIKNITVKRIDKPTFSTQHWFDFDLAINPGLIAIIGNKGSGKSAISDILGHLCKCRTMGEASFLNQERFRSIKGNISKDYQAEITWYDDEKNSYTLDAVQYNTTIEDAQYLPQQYIEKLCNNLDDSFQNEINNVIFSYIDITEKGKSTNLEELKNNISAPLEIEISNTKSNLSISIDKLIRYELMLDKNYKKEIEDNLKKRRDDLERNNKNKPKEVKKPETQQADDYQDKLADFEIKQANIEKKIEEKQNEYKLLLEKTSQLDIFIQRIKSLEHNIQELNKELPLLSNSHSIDKESLKITYTTPLDAIGKIYSEYEEKKSQIQRLLAPITFGNDMAEPINKDTILLELEEVTRNKAELISNADATEKEYQAYVQSLKEWNVATKLIIGTAEQENSIEFYSKQLEYINTRLSVDYGEEKKNFYGLIESIFVNKKTIIDKLNTLYSPIRGELESALGSIDEKIEFDIEVSLEERSKDFSESILQFINQKLAGKFFRHAGIGEMQKLVEETDFSNISSIIKFIKTIHADINSDFSQSVKKVKDKKSLYLKLASLDYLVINFVLKLGGRSLQELSPGERGIVLLVFYLALNKKDNPLIIDQPEDNLDNQSVFDKLVQCISKAKQKRQVVIVTHNPNIAIACDAEQIIYCSMNKKERSITYTSGAIEEEIMKNHVIDVLEGTMPAFDLRRMKYKGESPIA